LRERVDVGGAGAEGPYGTAGRAWRPQIPRAVPQMAESGQAGERRAVGLAGQYALRPQEPDPPAQLEVALVAECFGARAPAIVRQAEAQRYARLAPAVEQAVRSGREHAAASELPGGHDVRPDHHRARRP